MQPRFVAYYSEGSYDKYDKYKDHRLLRSIDFCKYCRGAENRGAPRSSDDSSDIDYARSANGNPGHTSADCLHQLELNDADRQFDPRAADHDHHPGLGPKFDDGSADDQPKRKSNIAHGNARKSTSGESECTKLTGKSVRSQQR
jgi:hypothetical protein